MPPRKENSEAILMILPDRCSIMNLLASWANSNAAVRLTDTMESHWSRPNSLTSDSRAIPAELTRMSTEPSVSTQRCTTAAGTPGWVMSAAMNSIRRPAPSTRRRVVPSSSARPTANTSAPALARAMENALPRPVLPPVTKALRPARKTASRLGTQRCPWVSPPSAVANRPPMPPGMLLGNRRSGWRHHDGLARLNREISEVLQSDRASPELLTLGEDLRRRC